MEYKNLTAVYSGTRNEADKSQMTQAWTDVNHLILIVTSLKCLVLKTIIYLEINSPSRIQPLFKKKKNIFIPISDSFCS